MAIMATTSPKSSFCKIGLCSKHKPLKVMVLGQSGVGKSALVVRFITRRFIGEYDPTLEKVYTFHTLIDSEMVYFEILDTAGQPNESECLTLEANIRWAEAFVLMYSVTDKCSFDECNRLKFLINYNKRKRRLNSSKEMMTDVPVVLVGNKLDQWGDRMVSLEDGQRRSREIGCICFHEISVRESIDQVWSVFRDVWQFWKVHNKFPKLKRSSSDIHSPETPPPYSHPPTPSNGKSPFSMMLGRRWTEVELDEEDEKVENETRVNNTELPPFRGRASTDGHLLSKTRNWRYPPPASFPPCHAERRMSISMRGNNASY
ncbi:ras-related and estrogen-regulated growth inhibitor [Lycorma delicatula]|uniref:ras-related and estrogen-regulated growth inhibitor n=1 Tax=Lycorma delicatula TaxID=130591 RepID=UPI003F5143D9